MVKRSTFFRKLLIFKEFYFLLLSVDKKVIHGETVYFRNFNEINNLATYPR